MMIQLENITKCYQRGKTKLEILKEITLEICDGEKVAIIGRSGAGKSTLLNVIGGLTSFESGMYRYNGQRVEKALHRFRERHVGFILQNYALLGDRNAKENISLPLQYRKVKRAEQEKLIDHVAEKLGIQELLGSDIASLSGGECQRIAIARALVKSPDIILADEPTGALDRGNEEIVVNLLLQTSQTVILATHNMELAKRCSRIVQLDEGMLYG